MGEGKTIRVIYDTSEETRIREIERLREKALHDKASILKWEREQGIAEGIEVGRAEGLAEARAEFRASIIEKLKAAGMSEERIREILDD